MLLYAMLRSTNGMKVNPTPSSVPEPSSSKSPVSAVAGPESSGSIAKLEIFADEATKYAIKILQSGEF